MIKKLIFGIAVLVLSAAFGIFLANKQVQAPSFLEHIIQNNRQEVDRKKSDFEPLTEEKVLESINTHRAANKKTRLNNNEKLNKAAMARLAVINTFGDYTGSASALTREKALSIAGFSSGLVGDIYFQHFDNQSFSLESILLDSIDKEIVLDSRFGSVGIAKVKISDSTLFYLIFGTTPASNIITTKKEAPQTTNKKITWGGPDLWEAVNKERVSSGVGQLTKKDELCTIASIRLNQLLELGKLDGHSGFQPVLDRQDLKPISEKYNISEYLAQGYSTPQETVAAWKNTLGHKSLLVGGEYVWGCVYAQNTFSVAITAF